MNHNILFELGIVLTLGFFSAIVAKKLNQSVIIGYMAVGLLIGPNVLGFIKDLTLLNLLSELGMVFLMFFLGLEFSIVKFKKVKSSVLFIGTYEMILNLTLGFILGISIGLFVRESLFFATIVALTSSGVVAKILFDTKQTATHEAEVLMGILVFEDFISVVLLGILSSFAASSAIPIDVIGISILKSLGFYAIFILIGIFIINKFTDAIISIESQELFTAFMLGIILLVSSLAVFIGLASAAGAFLLGMIINSFDAEERLYKTLSPFKDIFLIVFFAAFGMFLNPTLIPSVLWIIVIAVPITIIGEILISSSAAYFSGFSSRKSMKIGTSMVARGEYSLIFATLGFTSGVIPENIYQFTGVYVFLMSLLAPAAINNSDKIISGVSRVVPRFVKYGMRLVSVTMKPLLMPEEIGLSVRRSYKYLVHFSLYMVIVICAFIVEDIYLLAILCILGLFETYELTKLFSLKVKNIEEQIDYHKLHEGHFNLDTIIKFISGLFTALLAIIVLGASFWNFGAAILISLLIAYILFVLAVSMYVYTSNKPYLS